MLKYDDFVIAIENGKELTTNDVALIAHIEDCENCEEHEGCEGCEYCVNISKEIAEEFKNYLSHCQTQLMDKLNVISMRYFITIL